jgi:metal-sulfur cluster biosynthetic enzyme
MITEKAVVNVFKSYQDPELGIDIWTLGLIYGHTVEGSKVTVKLTFTTPFCPYGPQMVEELEEQIREVGASEVKIEVTFDPPWEPSDELREMMGI